MGRETIIKIFPKLSTDPKFKISSPETDNYNCIAWAYMLYEDRWMGTPRDAVIFDGINVNWWPEGVNDCDDISCLVEAFAQIGYSFCETSENEPGFLKIALYYNPNNNQWTHAARESRDGTYWMSKLGRSNDIHHENPYTLEGNAYGKVYCIMKKPK